MKSKIISIVFQIGVNVIGLPDFHTVQFKCWSGKTSYVGSKFHR